MTRRPRGGCIDALDGATRRFIKLSDSPTTVAVAARNVNQM